MECLQSFGYEVSRLSCDGYMSEICTVMTAARVSFNSAEAEKLNICRSCRLARESLMSSSKIKSMFIDEYLVGNISTGKSDILADIDISNWHSFEIDGVPIGRFASYEFLLEHKIDPKNMTDELWPQYFTHLEQCVLTYQATNEILQSIKPDVAFVYNNLYSVNHTFESVMSLRGIPTFRIHGGLDFRHIHETLCLSQGVSVNLRANKSEEWLEASHRILERDQIKQVFNNQIYLLKSKSFLTYSRAVSRTDQNALRRKYSISEFQRVLICATSSPDEMSAAALVDNSMSVPVSSIFADQIDWLEALIEIAKRRSDYHILIRIHPREFPNMRDAVKSEHALALTSALVDLPSNVSVIWPIDDVSIYDLLKIANVLLTGISSVGGEFLSLGIPVICHEGLKLNAYPPECVSVLSRREDYEDLIDTVLENGVDLKKVVTYFRWKTFQFRNLSTSPLRTRLRRMVWRAGSNLYYSGRLKHLRNWNIGSKLGIRMFMSGSRISKDEKLRIDHTVRNSLSSLMASPLKTKAKNIQLAEESNLVQASVNKLRKAAGLASLCLPVDDDGVPPRTSSHTF